MPPGIMFRMDPADTSKRCSGGSHFHGPADVEIVFYCTDSRGRSGRYHVRIKLRDRAAFDYDPRLGWEYDRFFTWDR